MSDLTTAQWVWICIAAFLVGFSKMGISGALTLVIPVFASIFGGKESTGMLLPMLLVGDVIAVKYYNQHAEWGDIRKLMPWALVGLVLGAVVGNYIDDKQFKMLIAVFVLICVGILIYTEKKGDNFNVPQKTWFYALAGIASGFSTMIGNAAGPIMSVYLIAMGFKKNGFIGTYAWFFLIINSIKVPLQIIFWHNIYGWTLLLAGIMTPAVALGAFTGILVVNRINEKAFRYIIIGMTVIAAIKLFF